MKWPMIALACLICGSSPAEAGRFTASALYSVCFVDPRAAPQDRELSDAICGAYVTGLTDGMFMMQLLATHAMTPCMPAEEAVGDPEALRLFGEYLKNHPQTGNNSAGLVMGTAIADAYKCGR